MNRLEEIVARMGEIDVELDAIRALDEPTSEDLTRTDALLDEIDALRVEQEPLVKRAERLEAAAKAVRHEGAQERAYQSVNVTRTKADPFDGIRNIPQEGTSSSSVVDRALSAFEDKRNTRSLSDVERDALLVRAETVPGAAAYALAHGTPAYRSAFGKFMTAGLQNRADYTDEEREALANAHLVRTALNITTGASGQFSLPTVFDPTLIHTGTATRNPIREMSTVVQGTQNVWNGVSVGNVTTFWHAEAAALTDGSPTLAHPVVTAGTLTAWVPASWEFFDDSPMVGQLPELIGEAFGYAESTAFVTGSGTNQPLGVVTAISATAGSTVTATTRGSFTTASVVDIFAVVNAVATRYENSSTWIGNKATFNIIRQMSPSGAGSLFWGQLSDNVTPDPNGPLLGYPTRNASDVLSTTTTGTVLLVLGDFSRYLIYDVIGTQVEFVQNVVNSSGIPVGQRGLIARKRVGANTTDIGAFRFLKM